MSDTSPEPIDEDVAQLETAGAITSYSHITEASRRTPLSNSSYDCSQQPWRVS